MFEGLLANLASIRPFAWRTALALTLVSATLLFSPEDIREQFALSNFVATNRAAISILLLLSGAVLFVEIFDFLKGIVEKGIEHKKYGKAVEHHLQNLTRDEKDILKQYIDEDASTIYLSYSSGTGNLLQSKGLITRSSSIGMPGGLDLFPYSIQPVARKLLLESPEYLE